MKKHTLIQEISKCLAQLRDFLPTSNAQYLWRRQLPKQGRRELTSHWNALRTTNMDFYCGPRYFETQVVPVIQEVLGLRFGLHTPHSINDSARIIAALPPDPEGSSYQTTAVQSKKKKATSVAVSAAVPMDDDVYSGMCCL